MAEALSSLPPMRGRRVAILADGGGHATIAADVFTDQDMEIPELAKETREKLRAVLPPTATVRNPVDVAGGTDADPSVFATCARILLEDPHIDGLLLVGLFGGYGIRFAERLKFLEEDTAHQMGKLVRSTRKPIVVHSLYRFAKPHSLELLRYYGIPVYDSLDIACKCVAELAWYGHYIETHHRRTSFVLDWGAGALPRGRKLIAGALAAGRHALLEHEARELLRLHGAPVPADVLAQTAEEAVRAARRFRGPVALKVVSPQILHKSEAGGVRLGLETPAASAPPGHPPRAGLRSAGRVSATSCRRWRPAVETIVGTRSTASSGRSSCSAWAIWSGAAGRGDARAPHLAQRRAKDAGELKAPTSLTVPWKPPWTRTRSSTCWWPSRRSSRRTPRSARWTSTPSWRTPRARPWWTRGSSCGGATTGDTARRGFAFHVRRAVAAVGRRGKERGRP